jgi:DNA-binding HxlR family transcriptional regulator
VLTPRSGCPISLALELLGDPWSLLVVRDLMFKGLNSFGDFLGAGEGIASNILADRLARLERAGIVLKRRDPLDRRRFVYRLTTKGIGLAPTLVELVLWSDAHEETDAPRETIKAMCEHRAKFLREVRAKWKADEGRCRSSSPRRATTTR